MKKISLGILIIALAAPGSVAWSVTFEQWEAFCKKDERSRERCDTAMRLCEQNDKADCDKIRTAFILEQPIPTSVIPNNSTD